MTRAAPTAPSPEPRPRTARNELWWRCFDPPLVHVRFVVRRSLDLGTTPGTSFAGVHGSEGELPAPARRAQAGGTALDEVSPVKAEDRPSKADTEGLFLLGRGLEVEGQARGAPPAVL